jgi:hypothetical protein
MSDAICKQCGALAAWGQFYDEDGCGPYDEPEDYCDHCLDVMAERSKQRREFDYYHPDEGCPESELTPMPAKRA